MLTQISGPTQGNSSIFSTRDILRSCGIRVAAPTVKKPVIFNGKDHTFNPLRWSRYEFDIYYFTSLKCSSFHTVCNEAGSIDGSTAFSIMTAMLYKKPIIMTHEPRVKKNVNAFIRTLIEAHVDKFIISNLDRANVNETLSSLPKRVDYELTRHEQVIARSLVRKHFRDLLNPTKKITAYKLIKTFS